ncbi:MAG: amidohydrolase [Bacillota bacterium]|nr:amidohydrolase [Candidatus Fermentithermobacillaceae bacterium]
MADILSFLDNKAPELFAIADEVWAAAEVGFQEHKSSKVQADYLEANGFTLEPGVADVPTAFIAEWGSGRPFIGFLGEFDALAGISQEVSPERKPIVPGGPGHGCGHNLLGTAALGAALALKEALAKSGMAGTVRYYGCPAEELLAGKVYMARAGVFDDLDVAITWHPGSTTTVRLGSGNAMNSVKFQFHGKTAHAAGDPHNGRSALDAVELLNVGANYLREHVIPDARIHYVITEGGGQPNVVPAEAEVWYFVRAPRRSQVEEIYARLLDVAKGAALMTGTTHDVNFLTGCYEVLLNEVLADVMWRNLQKVGAPQFDEADLEFAGKLALTFDENSVANMLRSPDFAELQELKEKPLATILIPPRGKGRSGGGSTDVGDVSWIVPTVQMSAATVPLGCPGHSWQHVASSGSSIGKKGMLVAAKTMALCGLDLVEHPEEIAKAKAEFQEKTKDSPYKCPFPKGRELPLNEFFKKA